MPFMHEDIKNLKENNKQTNNQQIDNEKIKTNLIKEVNNKEDKKIDTITTAKTPYTETQPNIESEKKEEQITNESSIKPQEEFKKIEEPFEPIFSWQASEYSYHEKGFLWYFIIVVIAILSVAAAVYFKQWLLIAVIIMFVIVFIQYAKRKPKLREYAISEKGLKIDDEIYLFKQMRSFWFTSGHEGMILNLQPLKKISIFISAPLGDIKVEDIRAIIGKYLPEQKKLKA